MGMMAHRSWVVRKALWNWIACVKFRKNRPVTVPGLLGTCRKKDRQRLTAIPLNDVFPSIPIYNIRLAHRVPWDEKSVNIREAVRYVFKSIFFRCQVFLYALFPPMQGGLPSIDSNPNDALRAAYTPRHRRAAVMAVGRVHRGQNLRPPILPLELQGSVDLGQLAVRGPYAGYLCRVDDDRYEWNLQWLTEYEHVDGLYRLGVRVHFQRDGTMPRLTASQIDSELGTSKPGDATWPLAKKLALCAVSTHTTLVRHWAWTHWIGGESISMATRNALPEDHPLCRLLWPHMSGTHKSNRFGTMAQVGPGGDYGAVFSFTDRGLYRLLDDSYKAYAFSTNDPWVDAAVRGLADGECDLPTQRNLEALFDILHRHARQYIAVYYATDREVQQNASIGQWLEEMNRLIPNGVPLSTHALTRDSLARFVAGILYLVTVYHETVGGQLWNYQLWTQAQPVRVSKVGRREPLDVYQRLVNMNYLLHVIRTPLINDFTPLALDDGGRQAFRDFQSNLQHLQRMMEREPWALWKLYPEDLEANINA